jgi:eukaryotic-like serine/threonine-protein kinase
MTSERDILNGRYRLVYQLGRGGMGSVWLAEDLLLERSVALKALVANLATSNLGERRARVLKEARALARVRHPAIVPVHDVFFVGDDPWIVMEHISGRSFDEIIATETLDERTLARIGAHVLRGLMAVHRAGVVHRDVKPANILVADDDSVFLVDFGIARIAGEASLTGQRIVGTPDFIAPERFRQDHQVGPPADIWGLGVTFYYALSGSAPFRRGSENGWEATMMAILKDDPRPLTRRGRLEDITLRMLDKAPARRANATEILAVLDAILSPQAGPAPAARPRPRAPAASPAAPPAAPPVAPPRSSGQRDRIQRPPSAEPVARGRRGPRLEDAQGMIRNVGSDTGVAMLLAMDVADVARLLADCPARQCGELLQGIAAVRQATASTALRLLGAAAAGRAIAYLRPETAAALLLALLPAEAARILDSSDKRTAARVIMELEPRASVSMLRSMSTRQRAAEVLSHVRPGTAAALLRSDTELATATLRYLSEPVRKQLSRHLSPGG